MLEIKKGDRTYKVWVLQVGQWCECSPARCHHFQARKTPSLVYDQCGPDCGHKCEELNLDDASIWHWVQELMQTGLDHVV